MADSASIGELFKVCDLDGSGFIDATELASICPDLEPTDIDSIFQELDRDGDGKISVAEFSEGFKGMSGAIMQQLGRRRSSLALGKSQDNGHPGTAGFGIVRNPERLHQRLTPKNSFDNLGFEETMAERDPNFNCMEVDKVMEEVEVKGKLPVDLGISMDEGFTSLSCQEQVCELYQTLHNKEMLPMLSQFEDIVVSVIRDIRQQQCENDRLERSFKREKEQHARHLRQLEEEMEVQMAKVENRVKQQEAQRCEAEKEEMKAQLESEIGDLQANLKKLQRLGTDLQDEKPSDELRSRLDEIHHENRHLKSVLTDAQTSLALLKGELATTKLQLDEKSFELESEKHTLVDYVSDQDSLTRQIHLLHEANKKLLDTNDDLRSALESTRQVVKRNLVANDTRPLPQQLRGNPEYVRQYLQSTLGSVGSPFKPPSPLMHSSMGPSSLAEELGLTDTPGVVTAGVVAPQRRLFPSQDSCEVDSNPDDVDSGRSTMKMAAEGDSEYEPSAVGPEDESLYQLRKRNRMFRGTSPFESMVDSEVEGCIHTQELYCHGRGHVHGGEIDMLEDDEDEELRPPSRCSGCSRTSSRTSGRRMRSPGVSRQESVASSIVGRRRLPVPPTQQVITKEPERMYKVVLAGDAAVGKSSFIMRLCKNKFVANLNSTLGVDFQTKTLQVDGRVIALQLWDTAGQERFRSIAKSYFRRADGVLLVYDCTYERSFISVRDWVEAVEDGAQKKIPIMFVANKTDLRGQLEEADDRRCVSFDEGQKLAKEYDGLFIETSAKDGNNILEAVTELARLLRTNEDLEVQSVGMKLHDIAEEKKKPGCCNV